MLAESIMALTLGVGFLSPDTEGVWQLWVQEPGADAPVQLSQATTDLVWLSQADATGRFLTVDGDGIATLYDGLKQRRKVELPTGADQAALSPDGKWIAYSHPVGQAGTSRDRDLALFELASGKSRPFIQRAGLQHAPVWSADGSTIYYTQGQTGGGAALWSTSLDGSSEMQVTLGRALDLEPTVSSSGDLFIASNRDGDYDVYRIDPTSGEAEAVLGGDGYEGGPSVSPDGKQLLLISDRGGRRAIWKASAGGTELAPVVQGRPLRQPRWLLTDANWVAEDGWVAHLRVDDEGRWQPWTVRTDGTGLRRIAELPKDPSRISVTADGTRLLANCSDGTLYLVELPGGSFREIKVDPAGSTDASIAPDGRRIAYSASTLGGIDTNDIWVVPVEGGSGVKLTSQNYMQHFPTWTPDDALVYLSGRGGQVHDLWRVPVAGGEPTPLLDDHRYNFEPTVGPDGSIVFSSNKTGSYDLYRLEPQGREPMPIVAHDGYDGQPSLSPSGRQVVFVSRRKSLGDLWIADADSGRAKRLTEGAMVRMPYWYTNSNTLAENRP